MEFWSNNLHPISFKSHPVLFVFDLRFQFSFGRISRRAWPPVAVVSSFETAISSPAFGLAPPGLRRLDVPGVLGVYHPALCILVCVWYSSGSGLAVLYVP